MEDIVKLVTNPLKTDRDYASADPYYMVGAFIILGVLSLAMAVANVFRKVKLSIAKAKENGMLKGGNHANA